MRLKPIITSVPSLCVCSYWNFPFLEREKTRCLKPEKNEVLTKDVIGDVRYDIL